MPVWSQEEVDKCNIFRETITPETFLSRSNFSCKMLDFAAVVIYRNVAAI